MSWVEPGKDRAFPEKLRALIEGRFPPEVLHFHTSNRCNLNCRFCWRNTEEDHDYRLAGAELSDERWRELTLDACEMGVPRITITGGGEPFMRLPVVLDMMEIIKSRGIQGDVVTNGTLLGTEAIERMVRYGWDSILFSLHSPTSVRSDFLRGGPDSLKQTLRNVDEINRFKAASGSRFPKITFIMVITRDNVADLADMVALGAAYRVNTVCLKIVNEPGFHLQESSATHRPDAETLRRELRLAQDRASMCDIRMDLNFKLDDWTERREEAPGQGEGEQESQPASSDGPPPEIEEVEEFEPGCLLPYFECVVLPDGGITSCESISRPEEVIDSARDRSLVDIWRGESFRRFRNEMLSEAATTCRDKCKPDTLNRNDLWERFYREENPHGGRVDPRETDRVRHEGKAGQREEDRFTDKDGEERSYYQNLTEEIRQSWRCGEEEARRSIGRALEVLRFDLGRLSDPESAQEIFLHGLLVLVESLIKSGDPEAARELLIRGQDAVNGGSGTQVVAGEPFWRSIVRAYRSTCNYDGAISFVRDEMAKHPDHPDLLFLLGECLMDKGRYQEAMRPLSHSARIREDSDWVHFSLGKCLYLLGDHPGSIEQLDRNLAVSGDRRSLLHSWHLKAMAHRALGQAGEAERAAQATQGLIIGSAQDLQELADFCMGYLHAPQALEYLRDVFLQAGQNTWDEGLIQEALGYSLIRHFTKGDAKDAASKLATGDPAFNWMLGGRHIEYKMGKLFLEKGWHGQAIKMLCRGIERATALEELESLWDTLVRCHRETGDYDETIEFILSLLSSHPDNPLLHLILGECHMKKRNYTNAIASLRRAAALRPRMNWVHFSLGKCLYMIGDHPGSIEQLNVSLAVCDDRRSLFHSWHLKAMAHRALGQAGEAERAAQAAQGHIIGSAQDLQELADFCMSYLLSPQALEYLRDVFFQAGQSEWDEGPIQEALGYSLIRHFTKGGDKDAASKLATGDPAFNWMLGGRHILYKMGKLFLEKGWHRQAIRMLCRGIERATVLEEMEALWDTLVRCHREIGDYDKAIEFILSLLPSHPDNPLLHLILGECHMEKRNYANAIASLRRAAALRPKMNWAHFSLGKCLYLTGNYRDALKALDHNLAFCSDRRSHFHSWYFKAMAHHSLGQMDESMRCLDHVRDFTEFFEVEEISEEKAFLLELGDEPTEVT